jgi:hypothetical protein
MPTMFKDCRLVREKKRGSLNTLRDLPNAFFSAMYMSACSFVVPYIGNMVTIAELVEQYGFGWGKLQS